MFAVGSVKAGLGQENVVLGKTRATVVVPLGGVAVPLTVPGVAAALGMDDCGPLNVNITLSLTGENLLQSL